MLKAPLNLRKARILVTNDDGIHAPGLKVLEKVARSLSDDVWVVAPESEHSGASHALTLRRPLQVHRINNRRYVVAGTPTDCVLLAVHHIVTKKRPDLVLSGVNRGANLGEDVIYSGTVAAAMEAALLGIPAIAFSQVRIGQLLHWKTAAQFAPDVIRKLTSIDWPKSVLMNVNFPPCLPEKVTGIETGGQGRRLSTVEVVRANDPFEREVLWIGDFPDDKADDPASDLSIMLRNAISVTPLHFDLTHQALLRRMDGLFAPAKKPSEAKPRTGAKSKAGAKR